MCDNCTEFQELLFTVERKFDAALQGLYIATAIQQSKFQPFPSLGHGGQVRQRAPAPAHGLRGEHLTAVPQCLAPETVHVRVQRGQEPREVLLGCPVHHKDSSDQAQRAAGYPEITPFEFGG